ncbi:MAG: hypothetical protein JSU71_00620 [Betaproteobacteria bacterium]|nr:MAG: hypothetical protein JSU71_00620 [Betaproteobacteria bacterium]
MFVQRSHPPAGEMVPRSGAKLCTITQETENAARRRAGASEALVSGGSVLETALRRDCASARTPIMQKNPSRSVSVLPLFAAAFAVRFGGAAPALECPKHIADTQALIDRITARIARYEDRMHRDVAGLVYALLDDARMLLRAARQNHLEPLGPFDHARAFAKTDAALGHARAAESLLSRCAG